MINVHVLVFIPLLHVYDIIDDRQSKETKKMFKK